MIILMDVVSVGDWYVFSADATTVTLGSMPVVISEALKRNRSVILPTSQYTPQNRALGYSFAYPGEEAPPPSSSVTFQYPKHKENSPNYEQRRRDGEVVMTAYKADQMFVTSNPGVKIPTTAIDSMNGITSAESAAILGLTWARVVNTYAASGFQIGGQIYFGVWTCLYGIVTDNPHVVLPIDEAELLALTSQPTSSVDVDMLITSSLAKANARSLDALTAAAELPETIKTIMGLVSAFSSGLRGFKTNLLNLKTNLAKRKAKLLDVYSKRQLMLEALLRKPPRNQREIRERVRLQKQLRRLGKNLQRDLKYHAIESTSQLTNFWLLYRYFYETNVMQIQDVMKASKRKNWTRVSEQSSEVEQFPGPFYKGLVPSGNGSLKSTVTSQITLNDPKGSPFDQFLNVTSFSIPKTLWELATLSFVVDWFVNVGDFISAMSPPSNILDAGSCLARKWTTQYTYTDASSGASITVIRDSYARDPVINPRDHIKLGPDVNLNWKRQLDAAALSWGFARSILRSLK